MGTIRRLLATGVVLFLVSPVFAQHEWVGKVFFGWGDDNVLVASMTVFNSELYAGTYKDDGANICVRGETPPWIPSATDGFGGATNSRVWE